MSSAVPGIIEALNVVEYVGLGLDSRTVRLGCRAFSLQRGEDALYRRIVPDVAGPVHATGDAVVSQEPLEGLTGVLASPIRVMQHGLGLARRQIAITSASATSCAVIVALMDQPTAP